MSIRTELDRLSQAKEDIAQAIRDKGVEVGEADKLDAYPAKIAEITGGGGEKVKITDASYLCVNGERLSENFLNLFDFSNCKNYDYIFGSTGIYTSEMDANLAFLTKIFENATSVKHAFSYRRVDFDSITVESAMKATQMFYNGVSNINKASFPIATSLSECFAYNGGDIKEIDAPKCISAYRLFYSSKQTTPISIPSAENCSSMFHGCTGLSTVDLNLPAATDCSSMFYGCTGLSTVDLSLPVATSCSSMFFGTAIESICNMSLPACENAYNLFGNCGSLRTVENVTVGRTTNISQMFYNCKELESAKVTITQPVNELSSIINCSNMFYNCTKLKSVEFDGVYIDASKGMPTDTKIGDQRLSMETLLGVGLYTDKANESRLNNTVGYIIPKSSGGTIPLKRLTIAPDPGLDETKCTGAHDIDLHNASFERDGALELFNSLPDIAAKGFSARTINLKNNPCTNDDTLTEEDIAIATAKGYTVTTK